MTAKQSGRRQFVEALSPPNGQCTSKAKTKIRKTDQILEICFGLTEIQQNEKKLTFVNKLRRWFITDKIFNIFSF